MISKIKKNIKFILLSVPFLAICSFGNASVSYAQAADSLKNDAAESDTLVLTLHDALQIALSDNIAVKVADKEIRRREYMNKSSYGQLFPQINIDGNYQRTIKKQVMHFAGQSVSVGTSNTWSGGASLSMPLISATLWKSIKISAMDVEMAVEKARASKQNMVGEVRKAFYACLLAQDSYGVYLENYNNSVANYNEVKSKYEAGTVSKYDLITAEVNMRNAEPNVYDAKNMVVVSLWQLKALMGIDLKTEISCRGKLTDFNGELEFYTGNLSLNKNSSLKQLDIQMDQLKETYKMEMAKYYPSLNFSMSYKWIAMDDSYKFKDYTWNPYSIAGVTLSIPVFSGGQRYNNLRATKIQREQLKMQREQTQRDLEVSLKQSLNSMGTSIKQYDAAEQSVEGAKVGYEISKKRYEVGRGTWLQLNDSQVSLLRAKLNVNQAIYNFLVSKAGLDNTLGVDYAMAVINNKK
ncbi:MAG: TolC family protein [Bacteroidales bacterium]|nr:TolC family protein [Bacteroidales bacterium]